MRIVMVSADCRPNPGGIASHVWELADGLGGRGHHVSVIGGYLSANRVSADRMPAARFELRLRENGRGVHRTGPRFAVPRSALEHRAWVAWARAQMRALCASEVPDVVHWHTPFYDPLVVRAAPRESARVFTNHRSDVFRMLASPGWRLVLARLQRGVDLVLAPSPERAERSRELGVPAARCHFVPNGIDVTRFDRPGTPSVSLVRELGVVDGDELIIVVARPVPVKGLVHALRALPAVVREHPRARLLVVGGDGSPHQQELEREAANLALGDRVIWAGERPAAQMADLYRLATLCLVPSLSEGMSVAALEAMASGLPLVATSVGGNTELVADGVTGLLVPAADSAAIAHALSRLLSDADVRSRLGAAARARVRERYTLDVMCDTVLARYDEAIRLRRAR